MKSNENEQQRPRVNSQDSQIQSVHEIREEFGSDFLALWIVLHALMRNEEVKKIILDQNWQSTDKDFNKSFVRSISQLLNSLGQKELMRKCPATALTAFDLASRLFLKCEDFANLAITHLNMGHIWRSIALGALQITDCFQSFECSQINTQTNHKDGGRKKS